MSKNIFTSFIEVTYFGQEHITGEVKYIKTDNIFYFKENIVKKMFIEWGIGYTEQWRKEHEWYFDNGYLHEDTYKNSNGAYIPVSEEYLTMVGVLDHRGCLQKHFSKLSIEKFKEACEFPPHLNKFIKKLEKVKNRFELMDLE